MPATKAPKSPLMKIILFLALVAAVSTAMYSTMPIITLEGVSQRLQQVAEYISGDAAQAGKQGSLTYGEASIQGWGYDKFVTVKDVTLAVSAANVEGSSEWAVSAPSVSVRLDPLLSHRQIFRFTEPVTLLKSGKPHTTISYTTPIRFGFFGGLDSMMQSTQTTIRLPGQITLTPEPSAENVKPQPLVVSYDGFPEIHIRGLASTGGRETRFEIRNVTIEGGGETKATIGAIASDMHENTAKDRRIEGEYILTVSDFTGHNADEKTAHTCSLTSNISYVSDVTLMTIMGVPGTGNIEMKVNKLVVACNDFSLKLDGTIARVPDDALPTGHLKLSIENVKAFLASNLISEKTRSELIAALPRITGQPFDSITSLSVPVSREANGTLLIGKSTAEEASISLLADVMDVLKRTQETIISDNDKTPAKEEPPVKGINQ